MTRDEIIEYLDRLGLDGERWTEAPGRADMDDADLTPAFAPASADVGETTPGVQTVTEAPAVQEKNAHGF